MPVIDGKLAPTGQQQRTMDAFLAPFDGRAVTVKLSKPQSQRSLNQNAYYWGVCLTMIAQHTGHTTEEVHVALKETMLPRKFVKLGSREVPIQKTTTDLTTTEFENYLEQVRAFASTELSLTIPLPGE